jgi:hypothetical protein
MIMSNPISPQIRFERNLQELAVQQTNRPKREQMQGIVDFVKAAGPSVQIPMDKFKDLCKYTPNCTKGNACPYAHSKALQDTIKYIKFFNQKVKSQPSFKLEECRHGDQCKFGFLKCHFFHPSEEPQMRKVSRIVVSIPTKLVPKANDAVTVAEKGYFGALTVEEEAVETEEQVQTAPSSEQSVSLNPKWEESFTLSQESGALESENVQRLKEKFSHALPEGFEFFDARGEEIVAGIVDSPYLSAPAASSALSPLTLQEIEESDDEKEDPEVELNPTIAQPTGFFDESGVFTDEDPRFAGSLEEESIAPSLSSPRDDAKTGEIEQYLRAQLKSMQMGSNSLAGRVDSKPSNYKTIPCKYMQRLGYCNFQERCAFAHSQEELAQGRQRQKDLTGRVSRPLAGYTIPTAKAPAEASWRKAE